MVTNGMQNILRSKTKLTLYNKNRCNFTSVFFQPTPMKCNMNKKLIFVLPALLMVLMMSCEKKYQSPGHYENDLFADEHQEGKAYIMNEDECFDGSELVIASSEVKLSDSSKGRGKSFFLYKVKSGKVLKTVRDSAVEMPMLFLSEYKLKIKNTQPIKKII